MGQIYLENIRTYSHHGCMQEETIIGSEYRVDLWVDADLFVAAQTDDLNVAQTNAGGSISGADVKKAKVSTATKTLGTPKLNNPTNKTVTNNSNSSNPSTGTLTNPSDSSKLANGAVPACIANIKDNNQVSVQLKESIAKENDPILKNELIRKYAIYNNLKPEKLKC